MTRTPTPGEWEAIDDVMRREMPWWDRDGSEVEPLPDSAIPDAILAVLVVLAAVCLGALLGVHLL